jgi:nicotinate-nucleotide adenylyltransferase
LRIGIFGGSFNPVHNGHLKLAGEALSELNLDRVIFVPSFQTPLKKNQMLPADLRLTLLKKATKKFSHFSVSACEMEREGLSYTVDTLRYFRKSLGKNAVLYFLAGRDAVKNLKKWKSYKQLFRLCRFVVMTRPGYKIVKTNLPIIFMPLDAIHVSSSEVRDRLNKGLAINKLIPSESQKLLMQYLKKGR